MNPEKYAEMVIRGLDVIDCILMALMSENRYLMSNDCDEEIDDLDGYICDFGHRMEDFQEQLEKYIEYRKKGEEAE